MTTESLWRHTNQRLMAKIIAESNYEGCLAPRQTDDQGWELTLGGHVYRFRARRTVWDFLRIEPHSLTRDGEPADSAAQLVVDAQASLGLTDIVLANFLEELQNTLAGDRIQQKRLSALSAGDLLELPAAEQEGLLDGHPKALANRGRMGWGQADLLAYSPEGGNRFRLRWLAVDPALTGTHVGTAPLDQCLTDSERNAIQKELGERRDWPLVPVHPWQWDHRLQAQYAEPLARGQLVDLGVRGHWYRPQQSLRTLSNDAAPEHCDLKLALTILNTSCYRGIPAEPIAQGPALSQWLWEQSRQDPELHRTGLEVQRELAGCHVPHPQQSQVDGAPYRYHEMLGAVWRESMASKAREDERTMLMATLMQCDGQGRSLIAALIRRSGLAPEIWLTRLFDCVTLPIYHLLCAYGIGLVAHGQNLGLILRDNAPERVTIKDFHGDLRCVDQPIPEAAGMPTSLLDSLKRLPPEYLVHDLITGHFVTTLRFISPLLEDDLGFHERHFYGLLAERIRAYQADHPELADRFDRFPLLRPTLERVCINRVRFRIGYEDHAERPLPELGEPLSNPLRQPLPTGETP
ncbi:IucA/IucC family protein [Tamilnaduibacter salinus]|uniref:IucA/IucC family protein n=1 Tax=Tamilnaduibacter salinus TaxID=1484056 RepID=A0A2A2I023_9GAMM|nr:IucA/IucC family protein [Tamilnaduibacter salinus]PAV25351.1 IucA/IucC family protein [Tamilnaduibacter salinus]